MEKIFVFFCFSSVKIRILQNLADRQLKTRYVIATDTSKDTLLKITRKISQTLGNGRIRVVEQEDAMLNRDISVRIDNDRSVRCFQLVVLLRFVSANRLRHVGREFAVRTVVHQRKHEHQMAL